MAWRTCAFVHEPAARALLRAGVVAIASGNAAATLLHRRAPRAYARARTRLALGQRVARGAWSLALFAATDARGYRDFFERRERVGVAPPLQLLELLGLEALLMVRGCSCVSREGEQAAKRAALACGCRLLRTCRLTCTP